jgi:hypothetical protein
VGSLVVVMAGTLEVETILVARAEVISSSLKTIFHHVSCVGEQITRSSGYRGANSYGVDSNWYADSGATDHVTGELDKLVVRETYNGNDQIYMAFGSSMHIKHIGHSIIHTPYRDLSLRHILHVPQASKNLASVHCIASDNNIFFELHPDFFFIKDRESTKTLLQGKSKGGPFPLPSSASSISCGKQIFSTAKITSTRWHARLGHPSTSIVRFVLSKNNLPFSSDSSPVCNACPQQAKCHQLPYPISTSTSKAPLDLIFSNVWGLASDSISRFKYYVSFIDDYSKFTWINLIKHKSEVF